jgi:hypothetical protein
MFDEIAGGLLTGLGYAGSGESLPPRQAVVSGPARTARRWGLSRRKASTAKDPVRLDLVQKSRLVDALMAALPSASEEQLRAVLTEDCSVQLIGGDDEWRGHGEEALERIVKVAQEDPALRGRQLRIRQHPSDRQWTVVATFDVDGTVQHRVIVLGFGGERVTTFAYHTLG